MEDKSNVQQPKMVPPKLKLDLSGLNPSLGLGGGGSTNLPSSSPSAVSSGQQMSTNTSKTSPGQGLGQGLGTAPGQGPVHTTSPKNNSSPRYLSFAATEAAINNMEKPSSQSDHSDHSKVDSQSNLSSRAGSIMSVTTGGGGASNSRHHSLLKVDTNALPLSQVSGLGAIAEDGTSGGMGANGRTPRDEKSPGAPMTFVPHLPSDPKPNRRSMLTPRMAPR